MDTLCLFQLQYSKTLSQKLKSLFVGKLCPNSFSLSPSPKDLTDLQGLDPGELFVHKTLPGSLYLKLIVVTALFW